MFIPPQLAKAGEPESVANAVMEPKYDGHRILAHVHKDHVQFYARTGAEKSAHLPSIRRDILAGSIVPDTILDGEVIGSSWSDVQRVLGANPGRSDRRLTYMVFDVLVVGGTDCRTFPYKSRRQVLEAMFGHYYEFIKLVPSTPYDPYGVSEMISMGWEGVIVKDAQSRYASGKRGSGWIKVKATETVDVVVMGATEGNGKYAGQIGALVFGRMSPDGTIIEDGQCSGMTDLERERFTEQHREGTLAGAVIEIRHMGRMPSGGLRHPQFLRVRTDKIAADCRV